jgi:NAD(P)-dependent dehydrogenase (short-subunit alcohol dehydrogenase family)
MSTPDTIHDRTILVPGGTGNVGEGIVRSLVTAGAAVVVPSRSAQRLETLRDLIGPAHADRLIGVVAPYETFEAAEDLADTVRTQVGAVTDVVALIGGWWAGKPLWEISADDWQRVFVSPATTQTALVRAFLPELGPDGSYTTIAGFSAAVPTAGSGPVSMQGAAQLMMRRVLSAESESGPRINDVMLGPVINRSRPQGRTDWLTADQVGDVVARIVADPSVRDTLVDVQDKRSFEAFLQG